MDATTGQAPALASLRRVHKRYGTLCALDGVDLDVGAGELLALLGPNGAGKSTAIALLLGLIRPDDGSATLAGMDPQRLQARRGIGVMLQDAALPPTLRVGELIDLTASYYPAPRALDETAALAGIADQLQRRYGTLSGGQQRRVQFALAICGRPRLLFLDEPTVGMDIQSRQAVWAAMRTLVAQGCGVLLTTHYLEEAEALADRVCVLVRGRVVSCGSVHALRSRVSRKRVQCVTDLDIAAVARWPGVTDARIEGNRLCLSTESAEALVRQLLDADPALSELEVHAAGLAEAFTELTRDASHPLPTDCPTQTEAA